MISTGLLGSQRAAREGDRLCNNTSSNKTPRISYLLPPGPHRSPAGTSGVGQSWFISCLCFLRFKGRRVAPLHLTHLSFHTATPLCSQAAPTGCNSMILIVTTSCGCTNTHSTQKARAYGLRRWADKKKSTVWSFFGQPFQLHF